MFFLTGLRYPWLGIAAGLVPFALGLARGGTGPIVLGCCSLVLGCYRCYVSLRQGRDFFGRTRPGQGGADRGPASGSGARR